MKLASRKDAKSQRIKIKNLKTLGGLASLREI